MLHRMGLKGRMLTAVCGVVFVLYGFAIGTITYTAFSTSETEAQDKGREISLRYGAMVKSNLEQALTTARDMACFLAGLKTGAVMPERPVLSAAIKKYLEAAPDLLGAWNVWEPNALDGKDAENINQPGCDAVGRYAAYWNRVGGIHLEPAMDYDKPSPAGDYYLRPLQSGKDVLMEPVSYQIGGKDVMVVSACSPILANGKAVGVAGVDLSMDQFRDMMKQVKPFSSGCAFLVANNGLLVAYPKAEFVGKKMEEAWKNPAAMDAVRSGREYREITSIPGVTSEDSMVILTPITVSQTGAPWSLAVVAPMSRVLENARGLRNIGVLIGLVGLGLVFGVVFYLTNRTVKPLLAVAEGLEEGAVQVTAAAGEVASSSQSMSQRTTDAAASVEETGASLEQMSKMTKQNSENAVTAQVIVKETTQQIQAASEDMDRLKRSMDEISESGKETMKIVKTIDEIAFQTNLLALNAAVEAARAGEAGAGFAVVADEVRNLAQRAAEAAKNTSALIEKSVQSIQGVAGETARTEAGFKLVREKSGRLLGLVAEIAGASGEQAQGVSHISQAAASLNNMLQENAAGAEESAAAAQELNAQAETMRGYVRQLLKSVAGAGASEE